MKTTSALYKSLRSEIDAYYEVEVIQGGNTYGIDVLKTLKISPALFTAEDRQAPMIGGVHSTQCELRLLESSANWPRMASFTVRIRLSSGDDEQKSEWLTLGTFYTDERTEDKYGNLNIIAYDRMLMTEQYWTDKVPSSLLPANWPITSKAWCDMCESAGLMEVDSRTQLDDTVAFIGLNTSLTMRDVMKSIAVANGGNWTVTGENQFRLIPYASMVDASAAIAGIAIAGISVVGDSTIEIDPGSEYAYLGMSVKSFDYSPKLAPISSVRLETEAGSVVTAGDNSGYTLQAPCEWVSPTGLAELCLSKVEDYSYKPFVASGAFLDPAAEIGDLVVIDGHSYQMMSIEWNINTWPTASISAPYEEEVDHEYTIVSPEAKSYRKAMYGTEKKLEDYPTISEMHSSIEQTEQRITLEVSETYVNLDDYEEEIANLQSQIDGQISTYSGGDVPTLSNYPASDWTTTELRRQHVGALYLVTSDSGAAEAGQYYRFEQNGNNFSWVLVEDSALATALANAAAAQEAAEQAIQDAAVAQQAAENAQGTADQARLEAVAEAAQAQALATAAAAADATNKANQALADAKAYANQQVSSFVTGEYAQTMAEVQNQLDKKIETYYQATDPSLTWSATADHTGDLWYDTSSELYFRWDGTEWLEMTSNPPQGVFDQIDGKANVFISQPNPPYKVGDIWTQGASGDILRCETAREEGDAYNPDDWKLASKYTDDSALAQFLRGEFADTIEALKRQLDSKAETFYQADDPSAGGHTWDTVAGRAIVGISIVGSTLDLHVGDMWYRTTDDKTFRWNGTTWEEQTISREMFDAIDGKAQVFVGSNNPTPPYARGDLWFIDNTSEILTCVTDGKAAGESFAQSDWDKYNKYTDDTKANAVDTDLQAYKETVTATFEVQSQSINAKVSKTGGNNSSFGWTLTDSDWSLYSSNSRVLRATSAGIEITGSGTFTGTVNATGGNFTGAVTAQNLTITGGSISIGGTDSNPTFSVNPSGAVSASNLNITGGQISIGPAGQQPTFVVTSAGALTATNAIISGTINATDGTFSGTINSAEIRSSDITGGTITAADIESGTITGTTITGGSIGIGSAGSGQSRPPFYVDTNGSLTARDATITGTVYATDGTFAGELSAATGTFSGNLSAAGGTFSGDLQAAGGTFSGELQAATGTFSGNLQAVGGTFTGDLSGSTITGGSIEIGGTPQNRTFSVNSSGQLRATSADITGNVNIQSGQISIGTSGGQTVFSVDGSGNLRAKSAYIEGEVHATSGEFHGTISIGNGNFIVDQYGNLTANSGTFHGNVDARNIQVGASAGYIQGPQIDTNTIGADKIVGNSLSDAQITPGQISGASLSGGITRSLGYADDFHDATQTGQSSYPAYFCANTLTGLSSVYSREFTVDKNGSDLTLSGHYHQITANADGTVTIGGPYNSATPPSFRIADTQAYRDGVSAVTASAIHYEQGEGGETDYNSIYVQLTSSIDPTYRKTVAGFSNEEAVNYGYDHGVRDVNATAMSVGAVNTPTQDEDGYWISQATGTVTISATLSDGTPYSRNVPFEGRNINVTAAYNAGKSSGTVSTIEQDMTRDIYYDQANQTLDIPVKMTTDTGTVISNKTLEDVYVASVYDRGKDDGAMSVVIVDSEVSVGTAGSPYQESGRWYANADVAAKARATKSGVQQYAYSPPYLESKKINVQIPYVSGYDSGANTITADNPTVDSSSDNHIIRGSNHYTQVSVKSNAHTTNFAGTSIPQSKSLLIDVTANKVYTDGQSSVTIAQSDIVAGSPTWSSSTKKYSVAITATASNGKGNNTTISVTPTDAWNGGATTANIYSNVPSKTVFGRSDVITTDPDGRFKIALNAIATPQYTTYGNVTMTKPSVPTQFRLDIHDVWSAAASDGINLGLASIEVGLPGTYGRSSWYEDPDENVWIQQPVRALVRDTYNNRSWYSENTVNVNANSVWVNAYNEGVAEGESHYSGPTESVTLYCSDFNASRRVYTFQAQIYNYSFNVNQGYVFYFY